MLARTTECIPLSCLGMQTVLFQVGSHIWSFQSTIVLKIQDYGITSVHSVYEWHAYVFCHIMPFFTCNTKYFYNFWCSFSHEQIQIRLQCQKLSLLPLQQSRPPITSPELFARYFFLLLWRPYNHRTFEVAQSRIN